MVFAINISMTLKENMHNINVNRYFYLSISVLYVIQNGRTAVMYAVIGKDVETTKFLAISGADLTISDNVSTHQ